VPDSPLYALVGATATGKTDLAERLADALGAEIVCADSRQVFRELDVGTGKPNAADRAARPHHLFEALAVEERPSAGWYARAAGAVIEDVRARGRAPLLVGGAGLYLKALERGLAPEPVLDPASRARLRAEHAALPTPTLRERLERLDPAAAARLSARDRQRISRALEVVELSGHPLAWWQARPAAPPVAGTWLVVELRVSAAELKARVVERTQWMFAHGLLDEADALRKTGREAALRSLRAVGYDEALDLLSGAVTPEAAMRRTAERTVQLAKRQRTWFRHQVTAARVDAGASVERGFDAALAAFRARV
jgi:tRNA dimethylallyltransferase